MNAEAKLRALLAGHAERIADDIVALVPELVRERLASLLSLEATGRPPPPTVTSAIAISNPTTVREPVAVETPIASPAAVVTRPRHPMLRDRVVELFAAGKKHAEIADELGISQKASQIHVNRARKIGELPPANRSNAARPIAASAPPPVVADRREQIAQHQTKLARDRAERTPAAKAHAATSDEEEEPAAVGSLASQSRVPFAMPPSVVVGDGRTRRRVQVRAKTIAVKRITREELRIGALMYPLVEGVERPRTWGECFAAERPCPWVACRHHLYVDVDVETGSIKFNFPDLEPSEMAQSCSLDVAERGGMTLDDVGRLTNLTRERVRQVETQGLLRLRGKQIVKHGIGPGPFVDRREVIG